MTRVLGVIWQQKYPQAYGESSFQHTDSMIRGMNPWGIDAPCSSRKGTDRAL